jgi:hypothetical protein
MENNTANNQKEDFLAGMLRGLAAWDMLLHQVGGYCS